MVLVSCLRRKLGGHLIFYTADIGLTTLKPVPEFAICEATPVWFSIYYAQHFQKQNCAIFFSEISDCCLIRLLNHVD